MKCPTLTSREFIPCAGILMTKELCQAEPVNSSV
jgi:hypothetical protein